MNNPRSRGPALIAVSASRGSPDAKLAILAFIFPRGVGLASVMVGGANSRSPPSLTDQSRSCGGGLADPTRGSLPPRVSTGPVVIRVLPVNCITGQMTLSIQVSHEKLMGMFGKLGFACMTRNLFGLVFRWSMGQIEWRA